MAGPPGLVLGGWAGEDAGEEVDGGGGTCDLSSPDEALGGGRGWGAESCSSGVGGTAPCAGSDCSGVLAFLWAEV